MKDLSAADVHGIHPLLREEDSVSALVVDRDPATVVITQQHVSPGDRGVRETHVGPHVTPDNDIASRRKRALPTTPEADGDRGRQRPAHADNLFGPCLRLREDSSYDHVAITADSAAMKTRVAITK